MFLQWVPLAILLAGSIIACSRRPEWHAIARLVGASLLLLGSILSTTLVLFMMTHPDWVMGRSQVWGALTHIGWLLFAVGYLVDMISRRNMLKDREFAD